MSQCTAQGLPAEPTNSGAASQRKEAESFGAMMIIISSSYGKKEEGGGGGQYIYIYRIDGKAAVDKRVG